MSIVNAVTKCTISLGFSIFRSSSLRTSSHTSPAVRLSLLGFQSRSLVTMRVTTAITPAIVGALRCQKDSYLQTLDTEVVSCEEFVPPKSSQPNGKSKTKKSTDPTKGLENGDVAGSKTWLVELADSVLFPEGGGQHTDYGVLTILKDERKEAIPIRNMQRHGLRCIHFSPAPLEPGTPVRQTVDFARRWDLMQQHTGQHLLSAVMDSMDLPTLGWSMGQPGEMNYVELPRKPSEEELQTIQTECNAKIRKSMPITVETPEGKGSDSLPEDYDREKGVVRFIKIGDMDYNACCGTHLQNSSHINIILLHHMQSVRGTNCRLFFTAGDRAIKMATESITGLRSIAVSLSSGSAPADVAAGVQRISDQVSEGRKKVNKLLAEIAAFEGDRIRSHLQGQTTAFMYRGADGLDFINLVLFEIKDFVKEREVVVVLCSGEIKSSGSIVVFGKPDLVEKMAVKVKEVVSTAKGGGKGEKWQGKVTEWQKGEIEALREAVHTQ